MNVDKKFPCMSNMQTVTNRVYALNRRTNTAFSERAVAATINNHRKSNQYQRPVLAFKPTPAPVPHKSTLYKRTVPDYAYPIVAVVLAMGVFFIIYAFAVWYSTRTKSPRIT